MMVQSRKGSGLTLRIHMPRAGAVHLCQRPFLLLERRGPACLHEREIERSPASLWGGQANNARPGRMELDVSLVLSIDARQSSRGPIAPTKTFRCQVLRRQQAAPKPRN
jgi:hypothetical protein